MIQNKDLMMEKAQLMNDKAEMAALVAELEQAAKPVEASEADTPRGVGSGRQSVLSEADSADDSDTDDNDESLDVPDG